MKATALIVMLAVAATHSFAADITGDWIAEVTAKGAETRYARVQLQTSGGNVTGLWNQWKIDGTLSGDQVTLSLSREGAPTGKLTGAISGGALSGSGQMSAAGGREGAARQMEQVAWKLTRPPQPPDGTPRTIDFEPKEFYGYYSASIAPVLHIFPGDTVRTRTYDQSGRDADRRAPGSNLETGPFYVEAHSPAIRWRSSSSASVRIAIRRGKARESMATRSRRHG